MTAVRELLETITHWVLQPGPGVFGGLAGLMLLTLYLGLSHAGDRDEILSIRLTGGLLALLSVAALGTGGYALLRQ